MGDQAWVAGFGHDRRERIDQAKRRSAPSSRMPPSELISPPSKAAVTFFRRTLGSENGRSVSSSLAGMAASVRVQELALAPDFWAIPDGCTTPASESLPGDKIGLNRIWPCKTACAESNAKPQNCANGFLLPALGFPRRSDKGGINQCLMTQSIWLA